VTGGALVGLGVALLVVTWIIRTVWVALMRRLWSRFSAKAGRRPLAAVGSEGGQVMTAEYAWAGGNYELWLHYPPGFPLHEPLAALWSLPALEGPVASYDAELSEQQRIDPLALASELAEESVAYPLYGTFRLPDGSICACRTAADRYDDGVEGVALCLPLGSLRNVWPDLDESTAWYAVHVDPVLVAIAHDVYERVPFPRGLIGFEISYEDYTFPYTFPSSRFPSPVAGVLEVTDGHLTWHPAPL
jgi:hypothetical protein